MNTHGVRAIYRFEMARTFRTITQSIASPVLSTSLYFVVFGAAIGARMGDVEGVSYDARAERMGITTLLNVMRDAGLTVTDLETHQSSLEEIFVDLMRQAP